MHIGNILTLSFFLQIFRGFIIMKKLISWKTEKSTIHFYIFLVIYYRYRRTLTLIPHRSLRSRQVTRSSSMDTILPTDRKNHRIGSRRPQWSQCESLCSSSQLVSSSIIIVYRVTSSTQKKKKSIWWKLPRSFSPYTLFFSPPSFLQ